MIHTLGFYFIIHSLFLLSQSGPHVVARVDMPNPPGNLIVISKILVENVLTNEGKKRLKSQYVHISSRAVKYIQRYMCSF